MADEEFWRRFLDAQERVKHLTPEQMIARLAELQSRASNETLSEEDRREVERLVKLGEAALLIEPKGPC